jgi:hypothetical protein
LAPTQWEALTADDALVVARFEGVRESRKSRLRFPARSEQAALPSRIAAMRWPACEVRGESLDHPPRRRLSRRGFLALGGATVAGGLLGYAWRIEPHWIEIIERALPIAKLPSALQGATLVHISDLHVGPIVDDDFLLAALQKVAALQPDILVMTGDFMTCHGCEQVDHALRVLSRLPRPALATIAVLGNHDYGQGAGNPEPAARLALGLADLGIAVLRNRTVNLNGLQVVGVDDLWAGQFRPDLAFRGFDPRHAQLALAHNPDAADRTGWTDFRGWILCGHTHGGQCSFPFIGAPLVPVRNPRYVAGEVDLDDGRRLYINRGLGYLKRIRFTARPEITVFTLQREGA